MISRSFNAPPGPVFQVIDAGSTRADLASRREVKYAFPQLDVAKMRRLLEANCRRLIHNERVSAVRSIYFDDARLSACRENLDGVGTRRKVRLRWYDRLEPGKDLFFEIKWRASRVTGKHRLQLRTDRPLDEFSYGQICRGLEAALPPDWRPDFLRSSEPVLIVEYKREHFAAEDGLRITLDYDIACYDQTGRQRVAMSFPRRLGGLTVLEGKTPVGREAELRRWLHPFAPRASRCSKYVQACVELGLIPPEGF